MRSLSGLKRSIWVSDFETTTDPLDCRVWAWGMTDLEDIENVIIDKDMSSFVAMVSDSDKIVYFHNLKFDGKFIIDWLLRNRYTHTTNKTVRVSRFSTLISGMGQFYSIKVHWHNGRQTEFRDSMKKIPMSVKNVAHAFNLDISKGEIDYHLTRPVGWEITPEERDYLERDVMIVAEALKIQIDEGMKKLTVGADSLAEFKELTGKKLFDRLFPILSGPIDAEIRRAYRGGFTYADKRTQGKIVGAGRVFDVNSLYPSVMFDRLLPYGLPIPFTYDPEDLPGYPLYIVSLTFTAKLKPNHIPCIQIKGSNFFAGALYQENITEPITMSCTNVDLALWEDQYDLEILEFHGGWAFHGASGVFAQYISKWMKVKAENTGGLRAIAKLHLNALYGKFATNPDVTGKVPVMQENDVVKYVVGEPETRDPVYTAMGAFITAYARDVTIRAAQAHYAEFLYADTDSLHLLGTGDPESLRVHPTDLGAWKHESDFTHAIFTRAKCYTEEVVGECHCEEKHVGPCLETHIAGMPSNIARVVRLEHHLTGMKYEGKLMPQSVPGGVVLLPTTFELKI